MSVTAVNDRPVVTAGATVGFTEQGSAVVLDAGLTLSDADNTTLVGASVSIDGFVAGDTLNFTNQNGITGSYDSTRLTRPERYRLGGRLSGGAALDHLLLGQRQPDQLRRQHQPLDRLGGRTTGQPKTAPTAR